MPKKLFIRTFGCQMNEYDSDKMADVLNASEGIVKTDKPEDADIILFNTCSVREKAQEKVFHDLGRVRHLKKLNPNALRRYRLWAANLAPSAAIDCRAQKQG
jgi:tRNA-2-methylthio-N6-dimethylallyladenosine synthase